MRQILLLFFVAAFATVQGQSLQAVPVEALNTGKGTRLVTTVAKEDLVGELSIHYGYSGQILDLKPDMSFKTFSYSCFGRHPVDSGSWSIAFNRMLKIQSGQGSTLFDIVRIDNKLYFVEPKDRRAFIAIINSFPEFRIFHYQLQSEHFAKDLVPKN